MQVNWPDDGVCVESTLHANHGEKPTGTLSFRLTMASNITKSWQGELFQSIYLWRSSFSRQATLKTPGQRWTGFNLTSLFCQITCGWLSWNVSLFEMILNVCVRCLSSEHSMLVFCLLGKNKQPLCKELDSDAESRFIPHSSASGLEYWAEASAHKPLFSSPPLMDLTEPGRNRAAGNPHECLTTNTGDEVRIFHFLVCAWVFR